MTTRRMGRIAAAGALAGGLLLLAGCSGGSGTATAPPPVQVPPVTGAPTAQSAPTSQPGTAQPTRTEVPSNDGAAAGPQRCTTGELSASLGQGDAGAGSAFFPLIFTNTGSRTCELRGFPGVSYVAGDDGHQVGQAAAMSGERGAQVPIAPGATAVAQLRLANALNFDEATCRPTPVRGLRVYPPGDTASLFVPMDGTGCAGPLTESLLTVQTITAP
ncbi:DUF4232 domain-containing protein [Pseudonocardia yunnanensis]|uniref:DUF4232 domain-containing protein n=1 Tax=Pseudonocardia yunnanensis TaxID=58107 RepID=A0ABW4ETS7_9PSEU